MKKIVFVLALFLVANFSSSQAQVALGMRGEAFNDIAYTEVVGNPYLLNNWVTGSVVLENGQHTQATLKFDIYANTLLYQGKNGETLALKNKFTNFSLDNITGDVTDITPSVFVNGYPATGKQTESTFYQLVADGKIRLLKYYKKTIDEKREFTSATTVKTFRAFQAYYVFKNNQLTEIQPNKKSIAKVLDEHTDQLDAYVKANNLNFKSDMDLQKLFTWYNSLN